MNIQNILEGKKTYIGLAIAILGIMGLGNYISETETAILLNSSFEIIGILIAVYGRFVTKK